MKNSENERIEAIYRKMKDKLFYYANNRLHNHEIAQEAVQEVFYRACKNHDKFLNSPNPEGWLMKNMKNRIFEILREKERLQRMIDETKRIEEIEEAVEDEINIDLLYRDLSETEEWQLVKMIDDEGYSPLEAAKLLNITPAALRKRYSRARRFLKKRIDEAGKG